MFLLGYDIGSSSVKASLVDANHIGESLTEIARENEHISYLLQMFKILRSALDGRKVEVIDAAYIIWSESHLLPTIWWNLHKVKGGSDPRTIPCSPVKSGTELRANLLDGGQGKPGIREERNEVMPKDVSDLMRHEDTVELQLKPF